MWKDIEGFDYCQVSETGEVRTLDHYNTNGFKDILYKGVVKKQRLNRNNYLITDLPKDGKSKTREVHRLVAQTFVANPDNLPVVNHIDGNKQNNYYKNLEWTTYSGNIKHAHATGLNKSNAREGVLYIKNTGEYIEFRNAKALSVELGYSQGYITSLINDSGGENYKYKAWYTDDKFKNTKRKKGGDANASFTK